ncbi:hypothetical protein OHB04_22745 [Streptomyces sp. NBC_01775]|uniref:hypothetical protein n=1 Tax=Streptomyces sp. NBC_01775 TaxID=2975939 RepID=UPI002DD95D9B|nr:hypothetical protein [Streptomyces sp. NBC_01775]WSB78313.1 hypothetical protein OHB04_22745 [Streptomyces sp. NBC_01775]
MATPARRPEQQTVQQIGIDADGRPIYSWPRQPDPVPQRPLAAYPAGTLAAVGCAALASLVVVAFVLVAVLIGLSIALVVLAIAVVALTICVLVLRSMWREHQQTKG